MLSATILAIFFVPVFFVWVRSHTHPDAAPPADTHGAAPEHPPGTLVPQPEPPP